MEKKEPLGPPAPGKSGEQPADETPQPGRPPHWHEGDPEPTGEEAPLPPKTEAD